MNEKTGMTPTRGLYLQIYHSPLTCASRMTKVGGALQGSGLFRETHLVGITDGSEPEHEEVGIGLRVVRIHVRRFPGGHLGSIVRATLWYYRVIAHYRTKPASLVAAHSVWVLPLCWVLSRASRCKLIYNAHELETETISVGGPKRLVAKVIEATFIARCALVSVVNESIADWYEQRYAQGRPTVVGNTPVVIDSREELRSRLGITDGPLLYIHTGNLVLGRNIPLILSAFRESAHHVVFLGDGPYRTEVLAARESSPNIHWLPPVEHERIVSHVREADVGLCLIEIEQDLSDRLSSPNKLLEALAAGIPALCTDLIEARRLLADQAEDWILKDPERELSEFIDRVSRSDVENFKREWPGLKSWTDEVAPLVHAVEQLVIGL